VTDFSHRRDRFESFTGRRDEIVGPKVNIVRPTPRVRRDSCAERTNGT